MNNTHPTRRPFIGGIVLLLFLLFATATGAVARDKTEEAVFAGGCFWSMEAIYKQIKGVSSVEPGYAGGHVANPTYEEVCTDTTDHAEAIRVRFNPAVVSYRELAHIFFTVHNPTTLNRQGADVGRHYRSEIFYRSPEQKADADAEIAELTKKRTFRNPIVTVVSPYKNFYPAEAYHFDYYNRNKMQPYCQNVVAPKVVKFRSKFAAYLKK